LLVVVSFFVSMLVPDGVSVLFASIVVELVELDGDYVSAGLASIVVVDELAGGVGLEATVLDVVLDDAGGVLAVLSTVVVEVVCVRSQALMTKAVTTARASAGISCFMGPLQCTQGLCRPF